MDKYVPLRFSKAENQIQLYRILNRMIHEINVNLPSSSMFRNGGCKYAKLGHDTILEEKFS